MIPFRRLNQSGITLVELLIALVLTTAISGLIISFSVDKLEQSSEQTIKYDLLTNAETGLNRIANDVRIATSADDNNRWQDAHAPAAPTDELSWQSTSSTLVLAVAAQDSHHNIIFDDAHDYISAKNNIIYYLNGTSLYRRMLAAPNTGNSAITTCPPGATSSTCPADADVLDNVSSFSVQYYGSDGSTATPTTAHSVQLNVTLLQNRYNHNITTQYSTRMVFRNG
ncbi:MAG TPA: prepilin-type N-terminal cleavage/methylation domain-containing protein [Candidatus Saccharimonadia bacterium]|nr:prepilin-type N-terminal cleavage/methylation domain-containing protein [Candidatus Saccharimonadia bacterium]